MIRFFVTILIIITMLFAMSFFVLHDIAYANEDLDSETGFSDEEEIAGIESITSKAAIIMDYFTGLVIYELNSDELRVPASMAKMFAAFVVFDMIRDGYIDFVDIIETSEAVSEFSYNRAYSNVPMQLDSSYTVEELLNVVIVRSASAATIALGEGIFGSEEALVEKMNEKAMSLGIDAEFHDSWGGSPDNRISARGIAEMTRSFIQEYPEILDITSQRSVFFDEIEYSSTNILLAAFTGMNGFKTGFTNSAGWCFVGTAYHGGRKLITVTMGSVRGSRFPDSEILLDYGFENYDTVIADHFTQAVRSFDTIKSITKPLVPISVYNIEEARFLSIRSLAIILNERAD